MGHCSPLYNRGDSGPDVLQSVVTVPVAACIKATGPLRCVKHRDTGPRGQEGTQGSQHEGEFLNVDLYRWIIDHTDLLMTL